MLLPSNPTVTLVLLLMAAACWGLWANFLKARGKWRYELYFLDFALGFAITAILAALVLGSFDANELTFQDNLALTGYRKMGWSLAGGFLFGTGAFLLAGAAVLAGLSIAFPISMGVALIIHVIWSSIETPAGNLFLDLGGAGCILLAVILAAYAHSARYDLIQEEAANVALQPDPRFGPGGRRKAPPVGAARGNVLAIFSGLFMGLFGQFVDNARFGDDGVSPYGLGLLTAAGLIFSLLFVAPISWNFPAQGRSLGFRDYVSGRLTNHAAGWLGGMVAGAGIVAGFISAGSAGGARTTQSLSYGVPQAAAVVAALCGLLLWREFRPANGRVLGIFLLALAFFCTGVLLSAVAQV